jgi:hypothetical protein
VKGLVDRPNHEKVSMIFLRELKRETNTYTCWRACTVGSGPESRWLVRSKGAGMSGHGFHFSEMCDYDVVNRRAAMMRVFH